MKQNFDPPIAPHLPSGTLLFFAVWFGSKIKFDEKKAEKFNSYARHHSKSIRFLITDSRYTDVQPIYKFSKKYSFDVWDLEGLPPTSPLVRALDFKLKNFLNLEEDDKNTGILLNNIIKFYQLEVTGDLKNYGPNQWHQWLEEKIFTRLPEACSQELRSVFSSGKNSNLSSASNIIRYLTLFLLQTLYYNHSQIVIYTDLDLECRAALTLDALQINSYGFQLTTINRHVTSFNNDLIIINTKKAGRFCQTLLEAIQRQHEYAANEFIFLLVHFSAGLSSYHYASVMYIGPDLITRVANLLGIDACDPVNQSSSLKYFIKTEYAGAWKPKLTPQKEIFQKQFDQFLAAEHPADPLLMRFPLTLIGKLPVCTEGIQISSPSQALHYLTLYYCALNSARQQIEKNRFLFKILNELYSKDSPPAYSKGTQNNVIILIVKLLAFLSKIKFPSSFTTNPFYKVNESSILKLSFQTSEAERLIFENFFQTYPFLFFRKTAETDKMTYHFNPMNLFKALILPVSQWSDEKLFSHLIDSLKMPESIEISLDNAWRILLKQELKKIIVSFSYYYHSDLYKKSNPQIITRMANLLRTSFWIVDALKFYKNLTPTYKALQLHPRNNLSQRLLEIKEANLFIDCGASQPECRSEGRWVKFKNSSDSRRFFEKKDNSAILFYLFQPDRTDSKDNPEGHYDREGYGGRSNTACFEALMQRLYETYFPDSTTPNFLSVDTEGCYAVLSQEVRNPEETVPFQHWDIPRVLALTILRIFFRDSDISDKNMVGCGKQMKIIDFTESFSEKISFNYFQRISIIWPFDLLYCILFRDTYELKAHKLLIMTQNTPALFSSYLESAESVLAAMELIRSNIGGKAADNREQLIKLYEPLLGKANAESVRTSLEESEKIFLAFYARQDFQQFKEYILSLNNETECHEKENFRRFPDLASAMLSSRLSHNPQGFLSRPFSPALLFTTYDRRPTVL